MDTTTIAAYRTLGRSGIQVSALGLGCAATGGQFYSTEGEPLAWVDVDDNESVRAIQAALDEGIDFFT
jgi:aryl-alcohol dehydrogenase-like predicted oxidoreductase